MAVMGAVSETIYCPWGDFETYNDQCMFDCNSGNYAEISTLSFNFIRSQCKNVDIGYREGICNSLQDLVYRNDSCQCPYCKCSSSGSSYPEILKYDPSKECFNCTCGTVPSYYEIFDKIYDCDQIMEAYNPVDWEFYGCPPNKCEVTDYLGRTRTYSAGQHWWADVGDQDTFCTKLCYCPATGDAVCATGFSNIVNDDKLNYALINDCDYDLRAVKFF